MAYSELMKSFDRIRDYMRDFYVFGFKRREEYDAKSARSYDNERRRIESLLGEYMAFRQESDGKRVFISIDSRNIIRNPLYNAFKAKSFTAKDIMLHFFILDMLSDGSACTVSELVERLENEYLSAFDAPPSFDDSTVRLKLREYELLGLLTAQKQSRELRYRRSTDKVPLSGWAEALSFYSEEDALGVVGVYLLDKLEDNPEHFRFKHHYILHALESEVLFQLLCAITEKRCVEISIFNPRRGKASTQMVTPLKIYVSTQGGRRYLLAQAYSGRRLKLYRLDSIKTVKLLTPDEEYESHAVQAQHFAAHLWGVSPGNNRSLDHVVMTVFAGQEEGYIPQRLEREKRCGRVENLGDGLYRFSAEVYDASEMLPWLRTFIGRIVSLECSNAQVKELFLSDLREMESIYLGGGGDAVS